MLKQKKVIVVMPAYNAEQTIEKTWREVSGEDIVDEIIVVDDGSHDRTVDRASRLDRVFVHVHPRNRGYGANQRRAIAWRSNAGRTSSSWSTPTTSTRRS